MGFQMTYASLIHISKDFIINAFVHRNFHNALKLHNLSASGRKRENGNLCVDLVTTAAVERSEY